MTPEEIRRYVQGRTDELVKTVGTVMEKDGERLAVLEIEIKHLREDQARQNTVLEDMRRELSKISTTMSEARGGWRVIALIGGISGTVGAVLTKMLPFLMGEPK